MWMFTKSGFVSCVACKGGVQVRARVRQHLVRLGLKPILETTDSDYRFRVVLQRREFARFVARVVKDLDYTNFKAKLHTLPDAEYTRACTEVWHQMRALQCSKARFVLNR